MLDTKALEQMVEKQISDTVTDQVLEKFADDAWMDPIEKKITKYIQDRVLAKFSNVSTMPDLVTAVTNGVEKLFAEGNIPGIEQYIDHNKVKESIDHAVENIIQSAISELGKDPAWLEKIERMINQTVVQRTVASIGSIDVASIIQQRVDEIFETKLLKNFATVGIEDHATSVQLTVMDSNTVIENRLTTHSAEIVGDLTVKDLIVKGSINTDNRSWQALADSISEKTLARLGEDWRKELTEQVALSIREDGIQFDQVKIGNDYVVSGNRLADSITDTNIQKTGTLRTLRVQGETSLNETVTVFKNRVGVNTESPDSALSIWDEEVSVSIGKHKNQEAYIGTNRAQSLNIGVNKEPQVIIDTDGITAIKKLRVGQHRIGHNTEVPNWSGTRGDIIFNSTPTPGSAFAWVCLGAFKWKTLKAIE